MKNHYHRIPFRTAAVVFLVLAAGWAGRAATFITWSGGGTDANWGTAANWSPSGPPPTASPFDSLIFNGSTKQANTNNETSLSVSNLIFMGGGFTLGGNAVTVYKNVTNYSGLNVISLPLTLASNPKTWDVAAGAELDVVGGTLTGSSTGNTPFEKTDYGIVRFKGTNIWAKGGDQTNGPVILDGPTTILSVTNDGYRLEAANADWTGLQVTNGAFFNLPGAGSSNLKLGAIALAAGTNEVDISSGEIFLGTGVNQILVGAAAGTVGVFNQSGGLVAFQNSSSTSDLMLANNAGAVGTYNLSGGILQVPLVAGGPAGGYSYFNFNGGTLTPYTAVNASNFIQSLTALNIQNGGAVIDTTNINVIINQAFLRAGSGGLTKLGSGVLTLTGANTYAGPTIVSNGELILPTAQTGGGSLQVADNAALGVALSAAGTSLNTAALQLGSSVGVTNEFFLGAYGNPASPVIDATNVTVAGTVTVNIYGAGFSVGQFSLIKYASATGLRTGSLVTGLLPVGVSAYVSNNVANASVDLVVTSAPMDIWTGAASGNWDIENSLNWYSPAGLQAVDYSDGSAVQFDDTATGVTAVNVTTTVSPGGVTVTNNALSYSFYGSGAIAGAGAFTKSGAGTVNLGTANTYSGNTVVNGGTLQLGTAQAIPGGAGAGDVIVNGLLDLNGNSESINGLSGNGIVDISSGSATLTVGVDNASGSFSGEITNSVGTLSLVKSGTGTETLTGNNGFSGGLTLAGGELQIASGGAIGTGLVQFTVPASGVTLASYDGEVTVTNPIDTSGGSHAPIYLDSSHGDIVLGNTVLVAGQDIFKQGYNNVWITAPVPDASLGGYLQLQQGSFIVSGSGWTNISNGIRTYAAGSDIVRLVITNGGTFAVGTGGSGSFNINLGYSGGFTGTNEVDISSGVLLLGPEFVQIIAGNAAGTVGVVNQTGGTVFFAAPTNSGTGILLGNNIGANGTYYLNGGTLITPQVAGGSGTGTFFFNGGTLTPAAAVATTNFVANVTAAYVGNGGAIIDTTNISVTVSQPLLKGGTGGLTKLGTATLTLSGANTYVGPTAVSNGGLWLPTTQTGGGAITVADGATLGLTLAAAGTTLNTAALTLGNSLGTTNEFNLESFTNPILPVLYATNLTVNGSVAVIINGLGLGLGEFPLLQYGAASGLSAGSFQLAGATVPVGFSAYLSNNVAHSSIDLVVTPAATLLWAGLNGSTWDIEATTNWVNESTLQPAAYADGSFVRLDDTAAGSTSVNLAANVAPAGVWVSNTVAAYSLSGGSGIGGVGGFTKDGLGTVLVGTPNFYTGNTVIDAGTLQLGASQVIPGGPGLGNVTVNGRLDLNGNNNVINGLTGSGIIESSSGAATLTAGSNNAAGVFSGIITDLGGSLTLAKVGTNTLALTGTNSFSGGVALSQGTLQIGNSTAVGVGTFQYSVPVSDYVSLATYSGSVTLTNAFLLTGGADYLANFDTTAGDLVLAGPVTSTAVDITQVGTNSLRFTSPTPGSGTGRLVLDAGNFIFDGTAWTNSAGAIRTYAPSGASVHVIITNGASLTLATTAAFNLRLGYAAGLAGTNELDISSGQLVLGADFEQIYAGDSTGTYGGVNQTGGTVQFANTASTNTVGVLVASSAGSTGWYYLNGGQLITPQVIGGSGTGTFYFNGGTLTPTAVAVATNFFSGVSATYVGAGAAIIDTTNISISIAESLLSGGAGGLTKLGSAALTLTGTNSYTGPTLVSNGTLIVNGSIGGSGVTVAGGTLTGTGVVAAPVTVNANGVLALGSADAFYTGTLTVSNQVTLNGSLTAKLNKSLALSNDTVYASGALVNTGSGTLTLTNAGPALVAGDTFHLFNQPLRNGGNLTLTPAPGAGLVWQNNLAVDGAVSVITPPVVPVNVLSGTIIGRQLTVQWPAAYLGWVLEVQTNSLTGTWSVVPGSASANQFVLTIDPAQGSVFLRLVPAN